MLTNLLKKYKLTINELEPAFLHISYANLNGLKSNERLEFLGDSIINFFTTLEIMNKYKEVDEGELTKVRARMVSSDSLSVIFRYFGLKKYLKIIGPISKKIEANTIEAVVACVYNVFKNSNREEDIKSFVKDFVLNHSLTNMVDYKSELQEHIQKQHAGEIIYSATPIGNEFKVEITCAGKFLGEGKGTSKKEAEQEAAKQAMLKLNNK